MQKRITFNALKDNARRYQFAGGNQGLRHVPKIRTALFLWCKIVKASDNNVGVPQIGNKQGSEEVLPAYAKRNQYIKLQQRCITRKDNIEIVGQFRGSLNSCTDSPVKPKV